MKRGRGRPKFFTTLVSEEADRVESALRKAGIPVIGEIAYPASGDNGTPATIDITPHILVQVDGDEGADGPVFSYDLAIERDGEYDYISEFSTIPELVSYLSGAMAVGYCAGFPLTQAAAARMN